MAAFPWADFPEIVTPRLRLREIVPADADDLFRFRSDEEVQRYNTRPMRSVAEAQTLVSTMQYWYRSAQAVQWGITVRPDERVVGICGLHDWQPRRRQAMLGYDLAREYWGRGLAHEAMTQVVRFGFGPLDLERIEAVTVVENRRSVRLLERLGFRRLEVRRERGVGRDGQFHDNAVYEICRDDHIVQTPESGAESPPTAAPAP